MQITERTRVYDILKKYGDIADVMEIFGIKRAGSLGYRKIITRFITVKGAAKFHKVPLDKFLQMLQDATAKASTAVH